MCDPKATAQLGMGLETVSTLGTTYAAYRGAEIEGAVARNNAQLAEWQAQDALQRGGVEELNLRRKARKLEGRQRAVMAAGNVDISQGSALDILDETARSTEVDAAVIRGNAQREAYGRRMEASGYRARARGANSELAGATSLLTGAGRVADRWLKYKETN